MEPWSDHEARWIRRAAEDVIRERRPRVTSSARRRTGR